MVLMCSASKSMVTLLHHVLVDYMQSFLCRSSHRICNVTFGNLRQAKRHQVHTARHRCTCYLRTAMRTHLRLDKPYLRCLTITLLKTNMLHLACTTL